jgi:hypothetical protein
MQKGKLTKAQIYQLVNYPQTPAEEALADKLISEATAEIQATWSPRERASRTYPPRKWLPPLAFEFISGSFHSEDESSLVTE